MLFAITFTLLSGESRSPSAPTLSLYRSKTFGYCHGHDPFPGNIRRFRRICEHIQSQVCSKRFPAPGSPPRASSVTNAVSESSSCGSDSSERLSCFKRHVCEIHLIRLLYSINDRVVPFHFHGYRQIENDTENDPVFECNKSNATRRSSASTNNNNQVVGEPGALKTVRSR